MKVLLKVIFTIHILLFLAGGLFLIAVSQDLFLTSQDFVNRLLPHLAADELLIWGALLFAVGFLTAAVKVIELRRSRCVAFDNPDGEVAIPIKTIKEFIHRVGGEVDGVIRLKSIIVPHHRSGLEVSLEVVLEEETNIPQLTETLQRRIKTQLQELLGIENIAAIQINVLEIKPRVQLKEI